MPGFAQVISTSVASRSVMGGVLFLTASIVIATREFGIL